MTNVFLKFTQISQIQITENLGNMESSASCLMGCFAFSTFCKVTQWWHWTSIESGIIPLLYTQ